MIVDKALLDELTEKAKANPRLRQGMDMRDTAEDGSQRLLNALEPGTVMPIHRHRRTSETVAILRGQVKWLFYDENGKEIESVMLDAEGNVRCIQVEQGRWHSLVCMTSGTILLESKNGKYEPLGEEDIMTL